MRAMIDLDSSQSHLWPRTPVKWRAAIQVAIHLYYSSFFLYTPIPDSSNPRCVCEGEIEVGCSCVKVSDACVRFEERAAKSGEVTFVSSHRATDND